MKTTPFIRFLGLPLLVCFSLFACKKDQDIPPTEEEQKEFASVSAESDATAEAVFNSVFDNVIGINSEVGIGGTGIFSIIGSNDTGQCYSITITPVNTVTRFPIQVVLDFGTGCTGRDGRIRRGKTITEYSNRLTETGATAVTRFEDYMVNSIKVEGEHVVANKSTNTRPALEIKVAARLSQSNGDFFEWNSERFISRIDGRVTALAFDDSFLVTGSASGFVKKGNKLSQWATVISEPLLKKFTCRWIMEGTVVIKKGERLAATIDYGPGQCDNRASFTVLGDVREITLR